MTHAELLRKHATDATNEGGMWFSGEYLSRIAETAESLEDENAKLREELEAAKHDLQVFSANLARLGADNAKLRELVRDMYKAFMHGNCYRWCEFKEPCNYISDGKCQWYDRMRELGVEVDG